MKNAWKKVASLMLAAALGVTACPVALAEEAPVQPELVARVKTSSRWTAASSRT